MKRKSALASTGHGTGALQARTVSWRAGHRVRSKSRPQLRLVDRRRYYALRDAWRKGLTEYRVAQHLMGLASSAGVSRWKARAAQGVLWLIEGAAKLQAKLVRGVPGLAKLRSWFKRCFKTSALRSALPTFSLKPARSIRDRLAMGQLTIAGIPQHAVMGASRDTRRKWARAAANGDYEQERDLLHDLGVL